MQYQKALALVMSESELEQRQQEELDSKTRKMKFDLLMGLAAKVDNFMNKDGVQYDEYGNVIGKNSCGNPNCMGNCGFRHCLYAS